VGGGDIRGARDLNHRNSGDKTINSVLVKERMRLQGAIQFFQVTYQDRTGGGGVYALETRSLERCSKEIFLLEKMVLRTSKRAGRKESHRFSVSTREKKN